MLQIFKYSKNRKFQHKTRTWIQNNLTKVACTRHTQVIKLKLYKLKDIYEQKLCFCHNDAQFSYKNVHALCI